MPASHFCGLDFGTSNSTIGIVKNDAIQLVNLENQKPTLRSAIFYDDEFKTLSFGQSGVDAYLSGADGRLMMALKSVLGSSIMQDKTVIFNELIPYTEVLGKFIAHMKQLAETELQDNISDVIAGRPVHFHDDDIEKDKLAENTLRDIFQAQGFKNIIFQYEPIAAATYYRETVQNEQIALVVDMGGGTSDFTLIKINPKQKPSSKDVLGNQGIHIGGTDFDTLFNLKKVMPLLGMNSLMKTMSEVIPVPNSFYHDLTTWHTHKKMYTLETKQDVKNIYLSAMQKPLIKRLLSVLENKQGYFILQAVENCKISLSELASEKIMLDFIESQLYVDNTRDEFNEHISIFVDAIVNKILNTVNSAGEKTENISAIFYTGGSSKIPFIREKINTLFKNAVVIEGDTFGSIGKGLALQAMRTF